MKWIIRVNMRDEKIEKVKVTEEEKHWGGRLLISKLLLREVPPTCKPIGRYNKLIFFLNLIADTSIATTSELQFFISLLKGRYGWQLNLEEIRKIAEDVLETEKKFNKKAGVSKEFYSFPEFMREEPLPPNNTVFDISCKEMQRIWNIKLPINEF